MTNEEKEEKTRDLLLEEIKMLDSMIDEVEDQLAQVGGNLRKLRVVREALQHVTGEQTELDLDS
jgi:prefoldin subunit 5